MSSLSVLDINPFSDVWFTRIPSQAGGCLLVCGRFPLLGAFLRRHPRVDFCPVPSLGALESSGRPPASQPRACSLLPWRLFPQTPPSGAPSKQPGRGGTFTPMDFLLFLWPILVTRRCFPSKRASSTCKGCVLLAISGLPHTGLCPPPWSCPPHVHFQSLCFTLHSYFS